MSKNATQIEVAAVTRKVDLVVRVIASSPARPVPRSEHVCTDFTEFRATHALHGLAGKWSGRTGSITALPAQSDEVVRDNPSAPTSRCRRFRVQQGSIIKAERKHGPAVWQFRWSETGSQGQRVYRKRVVGTKSSVPVRGQPLHRPTVCPLGVSER